MNLNKGQIKMTKEEALSLYYKILLSRQCEEKIRELYPQNEIKTPVHLGIGGEGIVLGICHCLKSQASFFGTYRNHNLFLALNEDTDGFFAELYGKKAGVCKGKGGSMHLVDPAQGLMATSAVVATTIPVAVGAALANQYNGSESVVVVFFGDGAVEEGVFWESLNFACLKKLRIIFVCEDNDLAIHAPAKDRQGFRSIDEVVSGFKCHHVSGDGTDPLSVVQLTQKVLQEMNETPMPAVIHLKYLRFLEHVGINEDFNAGYRLKPSAEELKNLDPVEIMRRHLHKMGASEEEMESLRGKVDKRIEASVIFAKTAPFPAADELLNDVLQV